MTAWVNAVDCERHLISRDGRIFSKWWNKEVFPSLNTYGYPHLWVHTSEGKKLVQVHTLIARTFIGPRPDGYVVDHINAVRTDNRVENLRYVNKRENMNRGKVTINKRHSTHPGVTKHKGLWLARARVSGKRIFIGGFKTEEAAAKAYLDFVAKVDAERYGILAPHQP